MSVGHRRLGAADRLPRRTTDRVEDAAAWLPASSRCWSCWPA